MTRMIRAFVLLVVTALLIAGSIALAVRSPKAVGPTYTPLQLLHSSQLQGAKAGQEFQVRGILYLWQIGPRGTAFFLFGGPKVGSVRTARCLRRLTKPRGIHLTPLAVYRSTHTANSRSSNRQQACDVPRQDSRLPYHLLGAPSFSTLGWRRPLAREPGLERPWQATNTAESRGEAAPNIQSSQSASPPERPSKVRPLP